MSSGGKKRLDELVVSKGLANTIKEAQAYIVAGQVMVNDTCSDKPGNTHNPQDQIRLKSRTSSRYVSRGGMKLEKALELFNKGVENLICIDIGASTGGFTDCLLQHGAKKVYAVDVAYGQLSWKLRQDDRVIVLERYNARKISTKDINEEVDIAVIDASFISLTKLIPPLLPLLTKEKNILALIKPQFELEKNDVGPKGVVKEKELHEKAIKKITDFASTLHLRTAWVTESPILGPKGNREFVIHLTSENAVSGG